MTYDDERPDGLPKLARGGIVRPNVSPLAHRVGHVTTDSRGDQVPACGWREAAARNRVDGALRAARAALEAALTVAEEECPNLPPRVHQQVCGLVSRATAVVGDADAELRKAGT